MENYDTLKQVAPNLVNTVTVPEFGSVTMLILIISILAIIVSARKFQVIR
jgi:predicted secreted protein with PEFG-CTERM motif